MYVLWTISILPTFLVIGCWETPVVAAPVIAAFSNLLLKIYFCLLPPLRNAPASITFSKLFQATSSRKSYCKISLLLMSICFNVSFYTISAEKRLWNVCYTKRAVIASFIERFKTAT